MPVLPSLRQFVKKNKFPISSFSGAIAFWTVFMLTLMSKTQKEIDSTRHKGAPWPLIGGVSAGLAMLALLYLVLNEFFPDAHAHAGVAVDRVRVAPVLEAAVTQVDASTVSGEEPRSIDTELVASGFGVLPMSPPRDSHAQDPQALTQTPERRALAFLVPFNGSGSVGTVAGL